MTAAVPTPPSGTLTATAGRRNLVLLALAAVQVVLVVVVFLPRGGTVAGDVTSLLGLGSAREIAGLQISDGAGGDITLTRAGEGWVLANVDGYPANQSTVDALLETLAAANTRRLIATTVDSHRRLRVHQDDFERRVIVTSGGEEIALLVGTASGSQAAHVRRTDQNVVYVVDGLVSWQLSTDALTWVDPVYSRVPETDLRSVTITNAHGAVELTRGEDGVWQMAGANPGAVDADVVTGLISAVATVRMSRPLGAGTDAEYATTSAVAEVTLNTGGAQPTVTTLSVIARPADDTRYVLKSSASPFYVEVSSFTVERVLDASRLGLLAEG